MAHSGKTDALEGIIRRSIELFAYSRSPGEHCPIFPDHIHIEPTNACNLRCVHCHQSSPGTHFTKQRGLMDFALYERIIGQLAELSERITLDSHGEPLNHPRIVDMVRLAKEKGLAVSLLTNGTLLSEDKADALIAAGLDRIVFSFEGSSPELHERVRRRSNYWRTMRNILYFMAANCRAGRPVFICMSMVKSSYTADDVAAYNDYFNALPIDTVFVNPLLNLSGGSPLGDEKSPELLKRDGKIQNVCRMPWMNMAIGWDGMVSPCIIDYNETHIVGDTSKESLLDIWNNLQYQKFRRCHLDSDFAWIEQQGPLCQSCNIPYDLDYDEYDLLHMKEYTVQYIRRQAQVLLRSDSQDTASPVDTPQYGHCLEELARFDAALAEGKGKAKPVGAMGLKAETLRDSALAGALTAPPPRRG
jgi:radical SAM protein with 4Fe4S-binding SPASM domain